MAGGAVGAGGTGVDGVGIGALAGGQMHFQAGLGFFPSLFGLQFVSDARKLCWEALTSVAASADIPKPLYFPPLPGVRNRTRKLRTSTPSMNADQKDIVVRNVATFLPPPHENEEPHLVLGCKPVSVVSLVVQRLKE